MSVDRYDVMIAREYESGGEKRTAWTRVGAAFATKSGEGFNLVLDAMPAPQDGQFRLTMMKPKPRDDAGGGGYGRGHAAQAPGRDFDDDVPF